MAMTDEQISRAVRHCLNVPDSTSAPALDAHIDRLISGGCRSPLTIAKRIREYIVIRAQ